ncbi:MAG: transposase [Flavobacteriales bacterium]
MDQRWEIEIFFKFLKQHLNFNHLVCRNENGIKVCISE